MREEKISEIKKKHFNDCNGDKRWTYHLVVFCDVSDLVDSDKVHKTVCFYLLGLGKYKVLLVVICLDHITHTRITIIIQLLELTSHLLLRS